MPAERGKDAAEQFAAAVDQGRSPRLHAGSSNDLARELEIVAKLRSQEGTYASHADAMAMLQSSPVASDSERCGATASGTGRDAYAPRSDEKARAKQRLMALLAEQHAGGEVVELNPPTAPMPLVVASDSERRAATTIGTVASDSERRAATTTSTPASDAELAPVTPLAARRAGRHARYVSARQARAADVRNPGLARRAGLVGSAALLVMVAFTGAGVFASHDALPGQTLYPIKRAAEAAGLAMTFDDEARAQRNLDLAAIRLSEVEQLIALKGGSAVDPQLFRAAMQEFDLATNDGSRALLSDQRVAGNGGIGNLQAWATTQSARLSALRSALPAPALPAADTSIALLDKLLGRSPALETSAPDDDPTTEVGAPDRPVTPNSTDRDRPTGSDPSEPTQQQQDSLPPIQPDSGPLGPDPSGVEPAQPEAPEDVNNDKSARLPLPLPGAPITLPPLLPGMPPLTIG